MALRLNIVSEHHELMGDDAERVFREDGGTIGRSLQNDWILPDRDRYVSGRHATIDHKGGIYYLLDTSSNGVYINDEVEPIGKGNPRRLFNGPVPEGCCQRNMFALIADAAHRCCCPPPLCRRSSSSC